MKDYRYLQGQVDRLISLMGGSENLINLFDELLRQKEDKDKKSSFITLSVLQYFEITHDELCSDSRSNSEARTICYRLHKEFLNYSIRKTGAIYNRQENAVLKGLQRMEQVIKNPRLDSNLYNNYLNVKNQVQKFIQYLNYVNEKEKNSGS